MKNGVKNVSPDLVADRSKIVFPEDPRGRGAVDRDARNSNFGGELWVFCFAPRSDTTVWRTLEMKTRTYALLEGSVDSSSSKRGLQHRRMRGEVHRAPLALGLGLLILGGAGWLGWTRLRSSVGEANPKSTGSTAPSVEVASVPLTSATLGVLRQLHTPFQIRYFAILDSNTVASSCMQFAGRVDRLLTAYAQASEGRVTVLRTLATHDGLESKEASAEGLKSFNIEKGNACYLGLVVSCPGRKEVMPILSPEWENALESDLSRLLQRLDHIPSANVPAQVLSQVTPGAIEEVKAIIPNLAGVSLEQGTQILRETALAEFKAEGQKWQEEIQRAEQALQRLATDAPAAERQQWIDKLQRLRSEQTEKLKAIAAKSESQIEALRRLKTASQ